VRERRLATSTKRGLEAGDVRSYLADVLCSLSYSVAAASNGKTALHLLKQSDLRFDLLLTDVVMPGMNSRELVKFAAELRPELRVIGLLPQRSHASRPARSGHRHTAETNHAI
jgi:CheY-like chemotaxis protein